MFKMAFSPEINIPVHKTILVDSISAMYHVLCD